MKINPLSVKGQYYVDVDNCEWCAVCEIHAPNNFMISAENYKEGAYVYKQPETLEEEKQCEKAMYCCPLGGILNNGKTHNKC